MITVIFYGLDQFVVGQLSEEMTEGLAKLYEVKEDEINFVAPENMVFHKGVDQTSWNVLVHVHAPKKVGVLQDQVADFIMNFMGDLAINKYVEFYYYPEENRYQKLNPTYPRYLTEDNSVISEDAEYDEDTEEGEGDDEIYTGDIFEGLEDKKNN